VTFRARVHERARRAARRVVLPEGDDARVRAAADRLRSEGLAQVEVLGAVGDDPRLAACIRHLRTRRPDKFPTDGAAREALRHPLTFGASLVGVGAADVMVGGAAHTSAELIRAALRWARPRASRP